MMHSCNYVTVKEVLNNMQKLFLHSLEKSSIVLLIFMPFCGGEQCIHETLNIKFSMAVNFAILREKFEFH